MLGLVITTFLFAALAPDDAWTGSVLVFLLGSALVCAVWTSGVVRLGSLRMLTLLALAGTVGATGISSDGRTGSVAVAALAGILAAAVAVVIGRGVLDQGEVNSNSVSGAIAVYLLLGLLFVFAYGVVARLDATPLFNQGTDGTRAIRVYFSYVTLATLGYGDFTPAGTVGRTLALVESLLGQLYLVTVVAVLVARLGERGRSRGPDDDLPLIPTG